MTTTARSLIALLLIANITACGLIDRKAVSSGLPDRTINLTPGYATTLEKVTIASGVAAALYYVYQPFSPNWEAANQRASEDTFKVSLRMKRFYTGGEGEALQTTRQYAESLQASFGADDYELLAFSQGIDSSTPIARRVAHATIRLKNMIPRPPPDLDGPPWPINNSESNAAPTRNNPYS